MYNAIIDTANILLFWQKNSISKLVIGQKTILWLEIIFAIVSLLGNVFILIGWYKGKGMMVIESDPTKKKDIKNKKKEIKKTKKDSKKK